MSANNVKVCLWSWTQQLLLRRQPQDDVMSYSVLTGALSGYLLVDVLQAYSSWAVFEAVAVSLLDVLVMAAYTGVVLKVAQKSPRFVQTLTALAGTGALLGVVGLPLFLLAALSAQNGEPNAVLTLGWLMLLVWHIAVQAHIFRHALTVRFSVGLAVAVLHAVVVIALLESLFPRVVETNGI